jgi:spermidine synthase
MLPYALTIFISAFLLFQVQPLIAKLILPWFGGSAMVWTSCMLFFQTALLGGYAYAHRLSARPRPVQTRIHTILLLMSILSLPILPKAFLKPHGGDNPLLGILLVLALSVGLPYFMLSTTGPLIQAWYAQSHPGRLPYRLFALSNFGSLLALLAYPIAVEPTVPLRLQGYAWSALYLAFVGSCIYVARRPPLPEAAAPAEPFAPTAPVEFTEPIELAAPIVETAEVGDLVPAEETPEPPARPSLFDKLLWIALAACASILLLAVTSYLSENVAAIPFLWVLPLSLYLLSFMLCFESDRWYHPGLFPYLLAFALGGMAYPFWKHVAEARNIQAYIFGYSLALFVVCMFCHGEIARRRPHPSHLTEFYLMISIGGASGGFLVSVAAPLMLPFRYELTIGLAITSIVAFLAIYRRSWLTDILWAGMPVFLVMTVYEDVKAISADNVYRARNFYGSLRITERGSDFDGTRLRSLVNGTINHGSQYVSSQRKRFPTTYYGEKSGAGVSILSLRRPNMRVGVIGLGTGTLTTYGRKGDHFKVYEINPLVVEISRTWFTYIRDCEADMEIVMGDARLSLESESPNGFDVLAVDAFSSDAIPVHLLTKEAVDLFLRHIRPGGVVAIHVSNKYLNLTPVVQRIAESLQKPWMLASDRASSAIEQYSSDWVLVANDPAVFQAPAFRAAASQVAPEPNAPLWTDDYSNLYRIMR